MPKIIDIIKTITDPADDDTLLGINKSEGDNGEVAMLPIDTLKAKILGAGVGIGTNNTGDILTTDGDQDIENKSIKGCDLDDNTTLQGDNLFTLLEAKAGDADTIAALATKAPIVGTTGNNCAIHVTTTSNTTTSINSSNIFDALGITDIDEAKYTIKAFPITMTLYKKNSTQYDTLALGYGLNPSAKITVSGTDLQQIDLSQLSINSEYYFAMTVRIEAIP